MKQTVVPAQVTTVEDKIAGNISFTQMLLLVTPVFFGGLSFILLPPFLKYSPYKVAIWALIAIVFITLAIRIKGRLVMDWIVVKGRYNLRPTYYIYNKNSTTGRMGQPIATSEKTEKVKKKSLKTTVEELDVPGLTKLENLLGGQGATLHFKANKKGGLSVSVKQVES
jgi:hypothetical protein